MMRRGGGIEARVVDDVVSVITHRRKPGRRYREIRGAETDRDGRAQPPAADPPEGVQRLRRPTGEGDDPEPTEQDGEPRFGADRRGKARHDRETDHQQRRGAAATRY